MWYILIFFILFSIRYAWWRKRIDYTHPRILMYHMIKEPIKNAKFNKLRVSPKIFEWQIRYLKNNGFTFLTMKELIEKKDNLPKKVIVITFDDGYEDNYLNAFPILKKYNAKATIYLVVDRHNREWSSKKKAHHNSGELKNESKLKDEQIKEMLKSGLIEIGSHTITHPNLLKLYYNSSKEEIEKSKEILEKTFNIECVSFCYPFGLFKNEDVDIVKNAGYLSATTTNKGISDIKKEDLFLLKRIAISGKDNKLDFILKIRSAKKGIRK